MGQPNQILQFVVSLISACILTVQGYGQLEEHQKQIGKLKNQLEKSVQREDYKLSHILQLEIEVRKKIIEGIRERDKEKVSKFNDSLDFFMDNQDFFKEPDAEYKSDNDFYLEFSPFCLSEIAYSIDEYDPLTGTTTYHKVVDQGTGWLIKPGVVFSDYKPYKDFRVKFNLSFGSIHIMTPFGNDYGKTVRTVLNAPGIGINLSKYFGYYNHLDFELVTTLVGVAAGAAGDLSGGWSVNLQPKIKYHFDYLTIGLNYDYNRIYQIGLGNVQPVNVNVFSLSLGISL